MYPDHRIALELILKKSKEINEGHGPPDHKTDRYLDKLEVLEPWKWLQGFFKGWKRGFSRPRGPGQETYTRTPSLLSKQADADKP